MACSWAGASVRSVRRRPAILNRSRLSRLAEDLLSNPLFAQTLASAVQKGLETKGAFDRNVQTVLGLLSLPSKSDVRRILTKLEVLQASLVELHEKIDRLGRSRTPGASTPPPRKPRARKPRAGEASDAGR